VVGGGKNWLASCFGGGERITYPILSSGENHSAEGGINLLADSFPAGKKISWPILSPGNLLEVGKFDYYIWSS
jgi:hypothetical protein